MERGPILTLGELHSATPWVWLWWSAAAIQRRSGNRKLRHQAEPNKTINDRALESAAILALALVLF
jgi:hypothetical protein